MLSFEQLRKTARHAASVLDPREDKEAVRGNKGGLKRQATSSSLESRNTSAADTNTHSAFNTASSSKKLYEASSFEELKVVPRKDAKKSKEERAVARRKR